MTSDKVSEARQKLIRCETRMAAQQINSCPHEPLCIDNLIAAVRAEQPAAVGPNEKEIVRIRYNLIDDVRHATFERMTDADSKRAEKWIESLANMALAAQPPAIGHVANCECIPHTPGYVAIQQDTDPRCKPGLLREAEVRLDEADAGRHTVIQAKEHSEYVLTGGVGTRLDALESAFAERVDDARAEVERLKRG